MNTILLAVLIVAILILAWVIRSAVEKSLKVLRNTNSATDQNAWHGNRVRSASRPPSRL